MHAWQRTSRKEPLQRALAAPAAASPHTLGSAQQSIHFRGTNSGIAGVQGMLINRNFDKIFGRGSLLRGVVGGRDGLEGMVGGGLSENLQC